MTTARLTSAPTALACWLAASAPATSAPAAVAEEAAQQAFRAGVDAARQERWTDARSAFEKAYGLSPRPVVLINLAGAQARTGQLIEAARNYRRILSDAPSAETAAFKRAASEVLPSLEARIPRLRLRATGLSHADIVHVDGQPLDGATLDDAHAIDPGEHTLVVLRDGSERARVLFALAEGESRELALPLPLPAPADRPPGATGAPAVGSTLVGAGPTSAKAERHFWASPWPWVVAGAVVLGGSLAALLTLSDGGREFSGNVPPGQISVR
jgi:hypothetical protein